MPKPMFRDGDVVENPNNGVRYRIEGLIGEGAFGQAYRAEQLNRGGRRLPHGGGTVCLKVTNNPSAWHGEAYFGLLTRGLPNVVQHYDSFPLKRRSGMRYVLIMELRLGGTVADWLDSGDRPWTEPQVLNALVPLSRTVGALHASGAVHRDITPGNVFVGKRKSLCLGDFGIARHGLGGRGPAVDAFHPAFVPTSILEWQRGVWEARDDVYQLGLLGLMLLKAEYVTDPDWRSLRHRITHPGLRNVLQVATGPRAGRYTSAVAFHVDLTNLKSALRS